MASVCSAPQPMIAARAKPSIEPSAVGGKSELVHTATFSELYLEHLPFVYRNVRRLLGAQGVVDDIVQDVFLVALRRLADFEGRSSFRTWLYAILRRVVSNHRRALRSRGTRDSRADLEAIAAPQGGPDGKAERKQAALILQQVLDQIDETSARSSFWRSSNG